MPKVKTDTAAEKRFRITKTGKLMRGHQGSRHLKMAKTKTNLRRNKEPATTYHAFAVKIKEMLPNAKT